MVNDQVPNATYPKNLIFKISLILIIFNTVAWAMLNIVFALTMKKVCWLIKIIKIIQGKIFHGSSFEAFST